MADLASNGNPAGPHMAALFHGVGKDTPRPKRFLPVGQIRAGYSFDATSMVPRGNSTSRRSDAREF
jgi:hypothetical protein